MKKQQTLRKNILLNQEQLAIFLDVSRSALAMYEAGERLLPTNALQKLSAIELAFNSNGTSLIKPELQQQKNSLQAYTQQQKSVNKTKAKQLQKQLAALQDEYSKALQLLQVVRLLQQQTPQNSKTKKDHLWLAATEAMAIEKINNCGLVAQEKLQKQINCLLL